VGAGGQVGGNPAECLAGGGVGGGGGDRGGGGDLFGLLWEQGAFAVWFRAVVIWSRASCVDVYLRGGWAREEAPEGGTRRMLVFRCRCGKLQIAVSLLLGRGGWWVWGEWIRGRLGGSHSQRVGRWGPESRWATRALSGQTLGGPGLFRMCALFPDVCV